MSEPIEWIVDPDLAAPTFMAAFSGWSDASDAATGAVRWLISHLNGERVARIRPNDFFDFTVARPAVRLDATGERSIVWPTIDVYAARSAGDGRDYLLMYGREPHLHWPEFVEAVITIAERCRVNRAVTLGAFLGPVLHRGPVPLTGYASDRMMAQRLTNAGAVPSTYEGQTGIATVLHDAFRRAGLPSVSIWAAVPFYLGSVRPNPRATHGLLEGVARVLDLDFDLTRIRQAADYFDEQIEKQVAENHELRGLIERLAARPEVPGGTPESAERAPETGGELPSAETIIRDLEDFLRGRSAESGPE
jgi:predicted ATP-grasp superfamily ATP-dependent carboligase